MSVEAMALVLHHSNASGTAKLVLLGIANHEGDGGAWPSHATLAKYANVDDRNVRRAITKLIELGELAVEVQVGGLPEMAQHQRPNRYHVLVRCPDACDRSTKHKVERPGGDSAHPRGAEATTGGRAAAPTKPSFEPPSESPVGSSEDGDGLPAGSPLRDDRVKVRPKPAKTKRKPLTPAERQASWDRFRRMDLEDLDDDLDVRRTAFVQLETWERAFEPDKWAQSMIDKGEWAGYCAGRGLGQNDDE